MADDANTNAPSSTDAPPWPLSRRSSSVSSATTVAALRTPAVRTRAAHSADEKRVTFRATPSVRYFRSTHTASFGSDALEGHGDDDASDQHPQWRAMRSRRVRRQLKPHAVEREELHYASDQTQQLVRKIAETAQQHVERAVRELAARDEPTKTPWTRRGEAKRQAFGGTETQTWERRRGDAHEILVVTRLPCRFRELQRVLETTQLDELDAALLACTHERVDRTALCETVETTASQLREDAHSEQASLYLKGQDAEAPVPTKEHLAIAIKRVALPRTKLAEAATVWRRVRRDETSPDGDPTADDRVELIDASTRPSAKSLDAQSASRVIQQMAALSNADHALVGEMRVGYVLQPDAESPYETTVTFFLSRTRKKVAKSFAWTTLHTVSDTLLGRLPVVSQTLWSYVERRRIGWQVLTYPDLVYCVSDIDEVQAEVTLCPLCDSEFGFLRRRHFCHVCALWVCLKCSSDKDVESLDANGWLLEAVKICAACQDRTHECVFDYDHGAVWPAQPVVQRERPGDAKALSRSSRHLAASWIQLLQAAASDRERIAYALVLDTLMKLLSPEEEDDGDHCGFQLSGLQADWQDLAPDELSEPIEELAEMLPLPRLTRRQCFVSHDSTRREYVLLFDDASGHAQSPTTVDEADRVKRVEKLQLLAIPSFPGLDALCALAAAMLRCPMAFVSAITDDRIVRLSSVGTSIKDCARDDGFCAYTLQSIHPLVVLDLARDMRSRHFTLTTEENGRFYCGTPLLSPDETFVMATFAVVGTRPRDALSPTAYAVFVALARAARSVLVQELEDHALFPALGA